MPTAPTGPMSLRMSREKLEIGQVGRGREGSHSPRHRSDNCGDRARQGRPIPGWRPRRLYAPPIPMLFERSNSRGSAANWQASRCKDCRPQRADLVLRKATMSQRRFLESAPGPRLRRRPTEFLPRSRNVSCLKKGCFRYDGAGSPAMSRALSVRSRRVRLGRWSREPPAAPEGRRDIERHWPEDEVSEASQPG